MWQTGLQHHGKQYTALASMLSTDWKLLLLWIRYIGQTMHERNLPHYLRVTVGLWQNHPFCPSQHACLPVFPPGIAVMHKIHWNISKCLKSFLNRKKERIENVLTKFLGKSILFQFLLSLFKFVLIGSLTQYFSSTWSFGKSLISKCITHLSSLYS